MDIHPDVGQRRIVVRTEGIEQLGAVFRRAVRTEQLVLKIDADFRNDGAPSLFRRGDLDRGNQVLPPVGPQHADRNLTAREDDRLAQILDHEAERRGRIGHRIGSVQHDEAVERRIAVADQPSELDPQRGGHVRRVDRLEMKHADIDVQHPQIGKLLVHVVEIERRKGPRLGIGFHADRSARVDQQNRSPGCLGHSERL